MQKYNLKHEQQCAIHDVIASFMCGVGIENVDVVDLETAKHLKKCGFNKPTHWYWQDKTLTFVEKGLKRVKMGKRRMNHNKYNEWIYSAPTRDEVEVRGYGFKRVLFLDMSTTTMTDQLKLTLASGVVHGLTQLDKWHINYRGVEAVEIVND